MAWFKKMFKSSAELSAEFEEKLNQRVQEQKELEARLRKEVEDRLIAEKMESSTPWFERIIGAENALHVNEQYRWNQAFIKDLIRKGHTGNSDDEVFKSFLEKEERAERERILEEERTKNRNSSEPWVEVVADEFDAEGRIAIKLDWNPAFIKYLKSNGFRGQTDEILVQMWLSALQRDVTPEDFA